MIADILHSFYTMPVNLIIGGVPTVAHVRWYKAPAGAKFLPFPSAIFSHVWDNNPGESVPGEIGEVGFPRTWDPGRNTGYQGQCFRGQQSWFQTGQLPALPLPSSPCNCQIPPAAASGGLVLTGSAPVIPADASCPQCPHGAPLKWSLSVAGGSGFFNGSSGTFTLSKIGSCSWRIITGGFTYALAFTGGVWLVAITGGAHSAQYLPATSFACLGITEWNLVSGAVGAPTQVASMPFAGP